MMGVVLWSDLDDQKAVFWCEDHGDLAYYDASAEGETCSDLLNAGDMVRFDMKLDRKMRRATNAQLVEQKVCHGLQDHLRASSARGMRDGHVARGHGDHKVVQLHPRAANEVSQQRMGRG